MSSLCHGIIEYGNDAVVIDIECHLSNNLPTIIISGCANRAVNESKDRLRGAFVSSGLKLPRKRITVNLAPADVPKADSGLDSAIAASILIADGQIPPLLYNQLVIGELGLDGGMRPVRGIIGKLLAARARGLTACFVPQANFEQARLVPHITIYAIKDLRQLYGHLSSARPVAGHHTGSGSYQVKPIETPAGPGLHDIAGQAVAKRALVIAAAGGHNLLLTGPPGTGKTMLAQALPTLLPPLSHEESLEVTHLHSLARHDYERLRTQRPFRNPHHSASVSALLGGGNQFRPGELSLSHRGVLCLDEFPEFSRQSLEVLRQPLEEGIVRLNYGKLSAELPARCILVATANPCPCGFYGSTKRSCTCLGMQRQRYLSKLSGPIIDRIDLCCSVHEVEHKSLLSTTTNSDDHAQAITKARQRQQRRYGSSTVLNSNAPPRLLKLHATLEPNALEMLQQAAVSADLSARAYMRSVRVARTIADLDDSRTVTRQHIAEALQYRQRAADRLAPV